MDEGKRSRGLPLNSLIVSVPAKAPCSHARGFCCIGGRKEEAAIPEIIEAEKLLRQIKPAWEGRTIVRWTAPSTSPNPRKYAKSGWEEHRHATSGELEEVFRYGKGLFVRFEGDTFWHISLRSTGWWLPGSDQALKAACIDPIHAKFLHTVNDKTIRMKMHLGDGQIWNYHDARCFGHWTAFGSSKELDTYLAKYGPDWLKDTQGAREALIKHKSRRTVQDVLTDQAVTAGIGFYLSNEIAFIAKIHPQRIWSTLDEDERDMLGIATVAFLKECEKAHDHSHWKVFDLKGKPCQVCQTPIRYAKQEGKSAVARGSYYCSNCQGEKG